MARLHRFLAFFLCLLLSPLALAQSYTSILVFGDSLSDTGNFAHVVQSKYAVRVPGTIADYTDGRFTDGTDTRPPAVNYTGIWIEQLATTFAPPLVLKNSLDGGTNYAYGFASTGTGTSVYTVPSSISVPVVGSLTVSISVDNIGQQVTDFLNATPTNPTPIAADTLVVVWGGANDLLTAAAMTGATPSDINTAVTTAVNGEITAIQRLIAAGAKNILVPNLPPLGAIPRLNANAALSAIANTATGTFNTQLQAGIASLQAAGLGVTFFQLDVNSLFNAAIATPATDHFTNVTASSQNVTGVNPDTYLFWDDLHPTTAGHHYIALAAASLLSPGATTTGLVSSAPTASVGSSITFTASVTAPTGSPSGTVTFLDGSATIGTATLTTNGTTTSAATFSTSALTAGTHTITASFQGSTGFNPSTSNAVTETITVPVTPTTTIVSSSAASASVGAAVVFTANVSASAGTPTGTVTFLDGTTTIGTGTLVASSATAANATFTTSSLAAGSHAITASYPGTATFGPSTSSVLTETITAPVAGVVISPLSPASLTLAAGSAGSTTVTVTPLNGYAGTVTITCGTLPAAASCVAAPLVFTASSSTAQTAKINISTSSKTPASAGFLLFPLGALGMIFTLRRRRTSAGLLVMTLVLAGAGLVGLAGCGSGNATTSSSSTSTPVGTYTVPVTVTPAGSGLTPATLSLTLNVQ